MAARQVRTPRWLLWFAATLLGSLAGGSVARAGCGEHARPLIPIERVVGVAGLGHPPVAAATNPRPADAPPRCNGPSCSRPPAAPTTAHVPDRRPPDPGLDAPRVVPPQPADGLPIVAQPAVAYAAPAPAPLDRPPRP